MINKETREEWRKLAKEAMHSWVGEYCPKDEFFALLDYIDELEAAQPSAQRTGLGLSALNQDDLVKELVRRGYVVTLTPRH